MNVTTQYIPSPHWCMLLVLAIDILGEITDLISGYDIVRLWLCGSKRLNYNMGVCGGVRRFAIESDVAFGMPWPIIASHFHHLKYFRLTRDRDDCDTKITNVDFNALPSTLTHIEVAFGGDAKYMYDALVASPSHFPQLTTVRVSGDRLVAQTWVRVLQGDLVRALPKSVSTIDIGRDYRLIPLACDLAINDLPPNVTTLRSIDMRIAEMVDRNADDEHMSSRMTTYSTTLGSDVWLSALPSHLQTLSIGRMRDKFVHLLPPRLTDLSVGIIDTPAVFLAALPPTLTRLHALLEYEEIGLDEIRLLPRRLVSARDCLPGALTVDMVAALPRTLTDLSQTLITPRAIIVLPPLVTSVCIYDRFFFTLPHPIPASCTLLKIAILDEAIVGKLPPNLTYLNVYQHVSDPTCIASLPASLTSLTVGGTLWGTKTLAHYFSQLPRALCYLKLKMCPLMLDADTSTEYSSSALPHTLETLKMAMDSTPIPSQWYAHLPPTIQYLRMSVHSFGINDADTVRRTLTCITRLDLSIDAAWEACALAHMPTTLHTLSVSIQSATAYVRPSLETCCQLLAALPPRIVRCSLPELHDDIDYEAAMRQYLPKTLVCLRVNDTQIELGEALRRPRKLDRHYREV